MARRVKPPPSCTARLGCMEMSWDLSMRPKQDLVWLNQPLLTASPIPSLSGKCGTVYPFSAPKPSASWDSPRVRDLVDRLINGLPRSCRHRLPAPHTERPFRAHHNRHERRAAATLQRRCTGALCGVPPVSGVSGGGTGGGPLGGDSEASGSFGVTGGGASRLRPRDLQTLQESKVKARRRST